MIRFISSIVVWLLLSLYSLKQQESVIYGKWEGVSRVLILDSDTVDQTWDQTGYRNNYIITFDSISNASILDKKSKNIYHTTYQIKNNILYLNNDQHPIEVLNDSILIYREVRHNDYKYFLRKFKKIN